MGGESPTFLCRSPSKYHRLSQDLNSVAVALIDGEGYIFSDTYVSMGKEGGKLAASVLEQAICEDIGRQDQVYVTMYLNRAGLAELLHSNGVIQHTADFDEFIIGFNQSAPLFSIVDVGHEKNATAAKVEGPRNLCLH